MHESSGHPISEKTHIIEFRNVSFRYPGQKAWALHNINLTLHSGEKLSIVGENGSGKTTFVKLLTRLYDVTEGKILLDGRDIRSINLDEYRGLFSAVFQDFKLFSFTLRENVELDQNLSDEEVVSYLEQAGLQEKINRLPNGISTQVNREFDEHGFEPSGGEAQKIALARALARSAPVVILDEPTAALDPRAEYDLYMRFAKLTEGKSAVFISHRLSSSQFCDHIAVFSNGRIIEYGTHEELVERNGIYSELYTLQAQFYDR